MSDLQDLASLVDDLVKPGQHTELYPLWRNRNRVIAKHVTSHGPLISQLRQCAVDRPTSEPNIRQHTVPHLDLDAVDRMQAIEAGAAKWRNAYCVQSRSLTMVARLGAVVRDLSEYPADAPDEITEAIGLLNAAAEKLQHRVEIDLPALVSLGSAIPPEALDKLVADVAKWRTWCRIFAGWETAPWKPHVKCPQCGVLPGPRKGLRVRFRAQSAVCLGCDATWDSASITALAAYVSQAQDEERTRSDVPLTQNRGT